MSPQADLEFAPIMTAIGESSAYPESFRFLLKPPHHVENDCREGLQRADAPRLQVVFASDM